MLMLKGEGGMMALSDNLLSFELNIENSGKFLNLNNCLEFMEIQQKYFSQFYIIP